MNRPVQTFTGAVTICLFVLIVPGILSAQSDHHYKGMEHYNNGEYELAIEAFETALYLDPMRPDVHLLLVSSYLHTGMFQKAERMAREGVELFPAMKALHWLLAETYMQMSEPDLASAQYRIVYEVVQSGSDLHPLDVSNTRIEERLGQIEMLSASDAYADGNPDLAIQHMEKAIDYLHNTAAAYLNLSYLYIETGQFDKNLQLLDSAHALFPDNVDILRLQALTYQRLDNQEQLLDQYSIIYRQKPVSVDDGIIYAELLLSAGKTMDAIRVLEELLDTYPSERAIYDLLISYFESSLNIDAKRRLLVKMTDVFPDDKELYPEIAQTYLLQQRWEEARQIYDSLRVESGNERYFQLKIAGVYELQDSLDAAENIYRELIQRIESDVEILRRLGRNLEMQNAWSSASQVYTELTGITGNKEDFSRLGVAYFNNDDFDKASSALHTAVEKNSSRPETFLFLSKIEHQERRTESAFENAEKAVRLSFSELEDKQKNIQGEISRSGLSSQFENQEMRGELEKLNSLAEESFYWFVESFPANQVEPVMHRLLEQYELSAVLYLLAGTYYANRGDNQKSIALLEESMKFNARILETHILLGELYEKEGRIEDAIRSYRRANGINPDVSEVYTGLIRLYEMKGELDVLCDDWLTRYHSKRHPVLKEHLIEALHKADRFEEAGSILRSGDSR
jgi:tetratricopeptide (TPR) repeat protein